MKTYKILITIISLGMFLSSSSLLAQDKKADRDYFTMEVDGLGCPFCAYGLEKKFKKFKGLKELRLDMETGIFTFTFPAEEPLSIEDVEAQVDAAGYTAMGTKIERADGSVASNFVGASDKINKSAVVKTTIPVKGTCNMCYARIKKAAFSVEGVAEAEWDEDSGILVLRYDKGLASPEEVQKAIAKTGHDTQDFRADDETYEALPSCCHYKRSKS